MPSGGLLEGILTILKAILGISTDIFREVGFHIVFYEALVRRSGSHIVFCEALARKSSAAMVADGGPWWPMVKYGGMAGPGLFFEEFEDSRIRQNLA